MYRATVICVLLFISNYQAYNIQRQYIANSTQNATITEGNPIEGNSSTSENGTENSQKNASARGFFLNHHFDSLSVEKGKAVEKIQYFESPNVKGTAKNQIVHARGYIKNNKHHPMQQNLHKIHIQHAQRQRPGAKHQYMETAQQAPDYKEQTTPAGDQGTDEDYADNAAMPDQGYQAPDAPVDQGDDVNTQAYPEQTQEYPSAAPQNSMQNTDEGANQQSPQEQAAPEAEQVAPANPEPTPPNEGQQPAQQPAQEPVTTAPLETPPQQTQAPMQTPEQGSAFQQPNSPIDVCPTQIENVGCYNVGTSLSQLLPSIVSQRTQGQSLEELLCACTYIAQQHSWDLVALSEDSCYSGQNSAAFENGGIANTCINDMGAACGPNDEYCQGAAGSASIYKIIQEKHRSQIGKKQPKRH